MLVYDITNDKSFENIKNWIRNIEEVSMRKCTVMAFHQVGDRTVIEQVTNGLLTHSNRAIDWLNALLSFPNGEHKQANGLLTRLNRSIE